MTIDKKLLEILRCPITKQQVFPLSDVQLEKINAEIESRNVVQVDGGTVDKVIKEGLITENRNRVYRVEQDIPIMLEDESILTDQFKDF